jgi:hypothetical protein
VVRDVSGDGSRERGEAILAAADAGREPDPLLSAEPVSDGPLLDAPIPDHTRSVDAPTGPPPEGPKKRKGLGLGQNRKRASGVRQLTKSDHEKIESIYITLGFGVMLVNQPAAQTIAEQATPCADAWVNLARENDSVRRVLLFVIEGGAWGAVFVAHLPIIFALLPEDFRNTYRFLVPRIPDSPEGNGPVA